MVDFVEQANNSARTIEELLVEFVPQVFKRYFQIFLLKANQQFVEILTTTYIFQSHSIYNIRVVYKSRQPANFAGFSARFRRLLSLLHESRYVEDMMFIRSKLLGLNK